uniref:Uncharacterized protein n=1 Tax=Arundo donax TaxID=35708 RepID=A0A0A9FVA0_ARUDO
MYNPYSSRIMQKLQENNIKDNQLIYSCFSNNLRRTKTRIAYCIRFVRYDICDSMQLMSM